MKNIKKENYPYLQEYYNYEESIGDKDTDEEWFWEIPEGWQEFVLTEIFNKVNKFLGDRVSALEIYQIKEKYCTLRIYWGIKEEQLNSITKEELLTLIKIIDNNTDKTERMCWKCGTEFDGIIKFNQPPICNKCKSLEKSSLS